MSPANKRSEGNETLTKEGIVNRIYERIGFSKKESADIVNLFFDIIKSTLASGEKIKISGFGNFIVRDKKPRRGRNPRTGDEIMIDRRRVVTFKPSPVLRRYINDRRDQSE